MPKPLNTDIKRYILVEDLTPASHKMLTALSKHKDVGKVWTIDGYIKFSMVGREGVMAVKSVFDPLSKVLGNLISPP